MTKSVYKFCTGLIVASAFGVIQVSGEEGFLPADVQHVAATVFPAKDPDIASYNLRFELRMMNGLQKSIFLPIPKTDSTADRLADLKTEVQLSDGKWETIIQSSWYGSQETKYDACMELPKGETHLVHDLSSALVLLKSQAQRLGKEPTLRLKFYLLCRRADGQVVTTPVATDGFRVLLPTTR